MITNSDSLDLNDVLPGLMSSSLPLLLLSALLAVFTHHFLPLGCRDIMCLVYATVNKNSSTIHLLTVLQPLSDV